MSKKSSPRMTPKQTPKASPSPSVVEPPPPPIKPKKPYEEIAALFNGNEVKIRVPKSVSKPPKLTPSQLRLQQSCTCGDNMSVCSDTCGQYGDSRGGQLNFTIPDDICESMTNRIPKNSEVTYGKTGGPDTMCDVCNVTPGNAPKNVRACKVMHPDKDVFVLKIGKQTDEPNRTGNIEVELITPKAPARPMPQAHACKQIQCEEHTLPCCMPCKTCRAGGGKKKGKRR